MYIPTQKELQIVNNNIQIQNEQHEYIDYKNKVCLKPWGYEFLVYESTKIGIWYLKLNKGHSTSLHCHFNKDTFIIVLSGSAKIKLIDNEIINLNVLSSIFLPKQKFHALSTFSDETYIIEIEIFNENTEFSDKNDLLRIDDMYQRKTTGYESSINVLTDNLDKYNYFFFSNNFNKLINGVSISVSNISNCLSNCNYNILIDGTIYQNGKYIKEGSLLDNFTNMHPINDSTLVLSLNKPDYKEDAKLIYDIDQLQLLKHNLDKEHKKIVLTSGCFDIIHVGHLNTLKQAKQCGDCLIVCLSNDKQIKLLKGDNRPINNYDDRINLFKTISYVDYIVLYDESNIEHETTLGNIMKLLDPEYWVKGNDYNVEDILKKHPYLRNIKLFDNIEGKSTTNIIKKIRN